MPRFLSALLLTFLMSLAGVLAPAAALAACTVDLNSATSAQLQALPGIGPAKAQAIISYRSQSGAFASVDQLTSVSGVGPATLANVRSMACVGDAVSTAATDAQGSADGASSGAEGADTMASSTSAGATVDINTATAQMLTQLPGIGPAKAAAIEADRLATGLFASCQDLSRVTGIGAATVSKLASSCTASPAP